MNDMRKLMEVATKADLREDRNAPHEINPREYAAFVYGVEMGSTMQYEAGGLDPAEYPEAYADWVKRGRLGYSQRLAEETTMNDMRKLMEIATKAGGLDPWGVPASKDDLKEQLKTLVFVAREKHGLPEAADYLEQIIADNF